MNDPTDLIADDPWDAAAAADPGGARPATRAPGPNGWKAAALVTGGVAGGALAASAIWCVALLAVMANHENDLYSADYGDVYDGQTWDAFDTDALTLHLNASPAIQEHVGPVQFISMNEAYSYSDTAMGDEWYYDVSGESGSGRVRVRFVSQDTFSEADLTLPDGSVVDLALPGPGEFTDCFPDEDAVEMNEEIVQEAEAERDAAEGDAAGATQQEDALEELFEEAADAADEANEAAGDSADDAADESADDAAGETV